MRTPLWFAIYSAIIAVVKKIFGHKYGCCDDVTRRCDDCPYVVNEEARK